MFKLSSHPAFRQREEVKGKFFFLGRKSFSKELRSLLCRYHGAPFQKDRLWRKTLSLAELGQNCLRTYTVPPDWLLALASAYGLRLLIGIPWAQHVASLTPSVRQRSVRQLPMELKAGTILLSPTWWAMRSPTDIVRWHGPERVRTF